MFEKLSRCIGKDVTCQYIWYGVVTSETAELTKVEPCKGIKIGAMWIPFIGHGSAIMRIYDDDDDVLYENLEIGVDWDKRSTDDILPYIERKFGEVQAEEHAEKERLWQEKMDKIMEEGRKHALSVKDELMTSPLKFIKPSKHEDWRMLVEKNTEDGYSCAAVEAAVQAFGMLQDNSPFDVILDTIGKDNDLTGNQMGFAAFIISEFSEFGEKFRISWNAKYRHEGDGVVNPACLVIKS